VSCIPTLTVVTAMAFCHAGPAPRSQVHLEVHKEAVSGVVSFSMACEDGSQVTHRVVLGSSKVRKRRFRLAAHEGGRYAAHGWIRVDARLRGRFTSGRNATGTFRARALVTEQPDEATVSCKTGTVRWATEAAARSTSSTAAARR
jgi:hypothetical protein